MLRIIASILGAISFLAGGLTSAKAENIGSTETELRQLLSLSIDSLPKEPASDFTDLIAKVHAATSKVRGYCSRRIYRDLSNSKLKHREYVEKEWRLDFVRPDRWHVTQQVWDDERQDTLADEWISIGTATYQNGGFWFRNDNTATDETNDSLLIDMLLDVLKRVLPAADKAYHTEDRRYLILTHAPPFPPPNGNPLLEICSSEEATCEIQSWIDTQSGYLVRTTILIRERGSEREKTQIEMSQSFTCFNEDILIEPPPWLNAEPASNGNDASTGQLVITNTEVPFMPHHESKARR